MKKAALALTAAMFMMSTVPAFAQMSKMEKDECLLASRNCTNQVDDIYQRMHKLNKAIKQGKRVYTPEELKKLKEKLQETDDMLKALEQESAK